jgi:uncharacterized integral membrane protein (TIGR00697 family)
MKLLKVNHLDLVVAVYIFGVVAAALMGAKVMPLGEIGGLKFNISVAIFLMPIIFTLIDSVNEIYGAKRARGMVISGIVTQILLVLFIFLALGLPHAARFEPINPAYEQVFGLSVRFALASVAAFALSGLLDVLIFARLKKRMHGRMLWLRNNLSNFIGELVDSAVFMTVAYYGVFAQGFGANVTWLVGLIIPYWLAKCVMSIVSTPLVYAGVKFLHKRRQSVKKDDNES